MIHFHRNIEPFITMTNFHKNNYFYHKHEFSSTHEFSSKDEYSSQFLIDITTMNVPKMMSFQQDDEFSSK